MPHARGLLTRIHRSAQVREASGVVRDDEIDPGRIDVRQLALEDAVRDLRILEGERAAEPAADRGLGHLHDLDARDLPEERPRVLMDAEDMKFDQTFDVVWSIESISHYPQKQKFFASAAQCLESGGTLALTDWFKKEQLSEREHKKFIEPIERGMLVELDTMQDYATFVKSNCMRVIYSEILNENCAKTWDLCLDILKNKALWEVAAENGSEFVDFLQAFRAMRAGFASGNFIYGLIIAKRL